MTVSKVEMIESLSLIKPFKGHARQHFTLRQNSPAEKTTRDSGFILLFSIKSELFSFISSQKVAPLRGSLGTMHTAVMVTGRSFHSSEPIRTDDTSVGRSGCEESPAHVQVFFVGTAVEHAAGTNHLCVISAALITCED